MPRYNSRASNLSAGLGGFAQGLGSILDAVERRDARSDRKRIQARQEILWGREDEKYKRDARKQEQQDLVDDAKMTERLLRALDAMNAGDELDEDGMAAVVAAAGAISAPEMAARAEQDGMDRRVVGITPVPGAEGQEGGVALDLAVNGPDGPYAAPNTQNGTADPSDPVSVIPMSKFGPALQDFLDERLAYWGIQGGSTPENLARLRTAEKIVGGGMSEKEAQKAYESELSKLNDEERIKAKWRAWTKAQETVSGGAKSWGQMGPHERHRVFNQNFMNADGTDVTFEQYSKWEKRPVKDVSSDARKLGELLYKHYDDSLPHGVKPTRTPESFIKQAAGILGEIGDEGEIVRRPEAQQTQGGAGAATQAGAQAGAEELGAMLNEGEAVTAPDGTQLTTKPLPAKAKKGKGEDALPAAPKGGESRFFQHPRYGILVWNNHDGKAQWMRVETKK